MKYVTQELEINIPQPFRDQTVNALLLSTGSPPDFNLVISRDVLPKHETLQGVVKKQIQTISNQENFKEMEKQIVKKIPTLAGKTLESIEIFIRFKSKGVVVFQKHLYTLLDEKRILILVGTTTGLWEEGDTLRWNNLISSLLVKDQA